MLIFLCTDIEKLDRIPRHIRLRAERKCRAEEKKRLREAEHACATETRLKQSAAQLKKDLAPSYRQQRPPGKLPRSILPKPERKVVVKRAEATEQEKLFIRGFTDENENQPHQFSAAELNILQSFGPKCIPFNFDFFLQLHGYIPSYDFKTEIELRDGDESKRFRYDDVLDEVYRRMGDWEKKHEEEVKQDILKALRMYNLSEIGMN